jgi:hypothetical protein
MAGMGRMGVDGVEDLIVGGELVVVLVKTGLRATAMVASKMNLDAAD